MDVTLLDARDEVLRHIEAVGAATRAVLAISHGWRLLRTDRERARASSEVDRLTTVFVGAARRAQCALASLRAARRDAGVDLHTFLVRETACACTRFRGAADGVRAQERAFARRRVLSVAPDVDAAVVEQLVDAGLAGDVSAQALVSEELDVSMAMIVERYDAIRAIERKVLALNALARDLALLVDEQDEALTSVAERVKGARDATVAAARVVDEAEGRRRASGRMGRWVCACAVVVAVVVVAALVCK